MNMNRNDMADIKKYLNENKLEESDEEKAFVDLVNSRTEPFLKLCFELKIKYPETWKLQVSAVMTSFLLLMSDNRDEAFEMEGLIRQALINADKSLIDL